MVTTESLSHLQVQVRQAHINDDGSYPLSSMAPLAGKNHVLFKREKAIYVVNRFFPFEVYRLENRTHVTTSHATDPSVHQSLDGMDAFELNGGMAVWLPETGEYLATAHRHLYHGTQASRFGSHYLNVLFAFSDTPPFRITRVSSEFVFSSLTNDGDGEAVQFINTIERVRDTLVVSYHAHDCEARVFTISLGEALGMLRSLPIKAGETVLHKSKDLS